VNQAIGPDRIRAALIGMALGDALAGRVTGLAPEEAQALPADHADSELTLGAASTQALLAARVVHTWGKVDLERLAAAYGRWAAQDPPGADPEITGLLQGVAGASELRARALAWHQRTGTSNSAWGVGRALALVLTLDSTLEAVTGARLEAELTHHDPLVGAFAAGAAVAVDAFARGVADPLDPVAEEVAGYEPLEQAVSLARARDFRAIGALCDGPRADSCDAALAVALAAARFSPGWEQGMGWALSLGRAAGPRCALLGALYGVKDPESPPLDLARAVFDFGWVLDVAAIVAYIRPLPGEGELRV